MVDDGKNIEFNDLPDALEQFMGALTGCVVVLDPEGAILGFTEHWDQLAKRHSSDGPPPAIKGSYFDLFAETNITITNKTVDDLKTTITKQDEGTFRYSVEHPDERRNYDVVVSNFTHDEQTYITATHNSVAEDDAGLPHPTEEPAGTGQGLHRAQERYQQVAETIRDVFWLSDTDKEIIYASPAFEDIWGISPDEIHNDVEVFLDAVHPEDRDRVRKAMFQDQPSGDYDEQYRIIRPDGETRWIHDRASRIDADRIAGVARDITEKKDRERELELKNRAIDSAPIGISIADASADDNPLQYVNRAFEELTGYDAEAVIGRNCRFLQGDETDEQPVANLREAIEAGETVVEELVNYTKNGSTFWNKLTVAPIHNSDDDITHFLGFQQDVTDRKQREQTLRRFRRAVEAAGHVIFITDTAGKIEYVNDAFETVTGYSKESALGETPAVLSDPATSDDVYEDLWSTIKEGEVWEGEMKNRRKNGEAYFAHETIAPIQDDRGDVTAFVAIQTDITDKKKTQEKLRQSQERFATLAESTSEIFWMFDGEFNEVLFVNDRQYETIWGQDPDTLRRGPENFLDEVHPADIEKTRKAMEALKGGEAQNITVRVNSNRDYQKWVRIEGVPVYGTDGDIVQLTGTVTDITEQKTTEKALQKSERRFRQMSENIDAVYYNYAPDFSTCYYVNPAYEEIWERSVDELHDDLWNFTDPIHDDDRARVISQKKAMIQNGLEGDTLLEYRIVTDSGEIKWIEDEMFGVYEEGELERVVGYARDITKRKQTEKELKKKQRQFDQLTQNIQSVFWITSADKTTMHYASPSYEKVWGRPLQDLYENPDEFVGAVHPDDQQRVREALSDQINGDYDIEYRIKKPDGEIRWVRDRAFPVENDDGEVYRIAGIANDITEKKKLEREREKFVQLVENSDNYIARADLDHNLKYINQAGTEMLGIEKADEIIGEDKRTIHPEETQEKHEEVLAALNESGEWSGERTLLNQTTGERIDTIYNAFTINDPETGEALELATVATDISRRLEIESQLREAVSQKETLLQEVHHRVKNNLQVILGILGLQARRVEHDRAQKALRSSKQRVQSMAMIHQKLYEDTDVDDLNFPEYVSDLVRKTLGSYAGPEGKPEFNTNIEEAQISIDSTIACGLIINELVANAVEHGFEDPAAGTVWVEFSVDNSDNFHLRVADDGKGADKDKLNDGSSLGMRLVRRLAEEQLGGDLSITNDSGLSVEVTFPKQKSS